jgi:hypothetical protein
MHRSISAILMLALTCAALCSGCSKDSESPAGPVDPACGINVPSLAFGSVLVGQSSDLTFTVTNTGGGTLAGTVSEDCGDFSIVGTASYSLDAGQAAAFTVRFSPTSAGAKACTVATGASQCAGLPCSGTGALPPACQVVPDSLDFGTVATDSSYDLTFTVTNTGGGELTGSVSGASGDYTLVSGGGVYSLTAAQAETVTVRFAPTAPGTTTCDIQTGGSCVTVHCTGAGELPPGCAVSSSSLDFGTVTVGAYRDTTFTITNAGGGTLTGSVSEPCADYSIVSGAGPYSLTAGQTVTVTLRFAPTGPGTKTCTVETGALACGSVSCTGAGELAPACQLDLASLDFGTVTTGNYADSSFTIANIGGGVLTGSVSSSCADYSITSGDGPYSLAAGESVRVAVRFAPSGAGTQACTIQTGGSCDEVPCTGVGELPPACQVSPVSLDFGTLLVGTQKDTTFTIENTGGGTLAGVVSGSCDGFSIVGAGSYSLGAGLSATFTVRFAPASAGSKACTIETGRADCPNVGCSGSGVLAPACQANPTTLTFGYVEIGHSTERTFTLQNTGGGTLSGAVYEECPEFTIAGGASYSLSGGQSDTFTVRFAPTSAGIKVCTIETGQGICSDITCNGGGTSQYDYYVDAAGGSDAFSGTSQAPFKTITHAVGVAATLKTIRVFPGIYNATLGETFPITLKSGQSLVGDTPNKGAGTNPTEIYGSADVELAPGKSGKAALVGASGASVAGFKIGAPYALMTFGILVANTAMTIADNTFAPATTDLYGGIYAFQNLASAILRNEFLTKAYGVSSDKCAGGMVVEGNSFETMAIPIDILGASNNTIIRDNTFVGNGQNAIGVQQGVPVIEDNIFDKPGGYSTYGAIVCHGASSNPKIRGNTFICNRGVRINASASPNLGTAPDQGGNNFAGVTGEPVYHTGTGAVNAIGNTWPNSPPECGADIVITGSGSVTWGTGVGQHCP